MEWKSSWQDEYLAWICAFANTKGGTLIIGKDDEGKATGLSLSSIKKLMVDIPNKTRSTMGILPELSLLDEGGNHCLEIVVEPYPFPISLRGKYYVRSGSTTNELTGSALDAFILKKRGLSWDMMPVPDASFTDLDPSAIQYFRDVALEAKRLSADALKCDDLVLLERLNLIDKGHLTIAALLLFCSEPSKWNIGAYTKVGFFDGSDILYQDEVRGPLIKQPDSTVELLFYKYLKAVISYKGIQRIESFPFAQVAIREALMNAAANKRYDSGIPIQIKIYDDTLQIYNAGGLPDNWTVETLFQPHGSKPYNLLIANVFYLAGFIESFGRGVEKICDACSEEGLPLPEYDSLPSDMMVRFKTLPERIIQSKRVESKSKADTDLGHFEKESVLENVRKKTYALYGDILSKIEIQPDITTANLSETLGLSERQVRRKIKELRDLGVLERIGSAKRGRWVIKLD